jgi:hypothetical protein
MTRSFSAASGGGITSAVSLLIGERESGERLLEAVEAFTSSARPSQVRGIGAAPLAFSVTEREFGRSPGPRPAVGGNSCLIKGAASFKAITDDIPDYDQIASFPTQQLADAYMRAVIRAE